MNKYRVAFNFTTGRYDVTRLEDMTTVSSDHQKYTDAQEVMKLLQETAASQPSV